MKCRPFRNQDPLDLLRRGTLPSLITPPDFLTRNKSEKKPDAYLCEDAEGLAALKKTSAFSPAPTLWRGISFPSPQPSPTRGEGVRLALAPGLSPLAPLKNLPPPPEAAFSLLLYQVLTQMKDFELNATLKVPVINRDQARKVNTKIEIVLGEQGRLNTARLAFDPYWGPLKLPHPVAEVVGEIPIVGIFAIYRMLSVEMDPSSRRIVGKGLYLVAPIDRDLQDGLVEQGKIPPELIKGPGYNLRQGIPEYTWQVSNIAEQILAQKKTEGFEAIGEATKLNTIVPLFEKGEVLITGDFSNHEIQIGKVKLKFFPKRANDPHRILLSGALTEPKMKIWGLKSLEVAHARGTLRVGHLEENAEPLELSWKFNFSDLKSPQVEIARLDSKAFRVENDSPDPKQKIAFTLRQGLSLENLWFSFVDGDPHLHIGSVEARQGELEGLGLRFRTSPADKAVFKQIHLEMKNGFPHFHSRLEGQANGELEYSKDGEELAWLKFQELKGKGSISTGRDAQGQTFLRLGGEFSTKIPSLRLLVKSSEMQGSVKTEIGDAVVQGQAALTVWPELGQASLQKLEQAPPLKISGTSGKVQFRQDTSEVKDWPEAKEKLGPLAAKLQTDFNIDVKEIGFEVQRMELKRALPGPNQDPALEITTAVVGDIRIRGDLHGKLWTRLPGGILHPLTVPEHAKMVDAKVLIGELSDVEKNGVRNVLFKKIFISGEESKPTLSPFDQKRCGFDRQQIHADLGLFGFDPESKTIQLQNLGKHFHIYLKNPAYLGGCLKIE